MKKKRRFGRRVFCVLIVLFMGVIWQSDLLSQEPAEVRSLRKQEILQTDDNYREYYFGLLTEDEKKIYREMLSGIQERQDEFYLTSSNEQLISKVYHALLKDHPELFWVHNREEVYTTAYKGTDYCRFSPGYTYTDQEIQEIMAFMEHALEEVKEAGWKLEVCTFDLHHDENMNEGNVMTEYEEKFSSMGNPIYKMIISR